MTRKLQLQVNANMRIDGQDYEAGQTIATIETELECSAKDIAALLYFGSATAVDAESADADTSKKRR